MSIEAWPFLISRNKTIDYSVIVAPDLVSKNDFSKLISLTSGDMTDMSVNVWQQMCNANDKTLTAVFRIEQAWINGERARDGFGRLIVQVVGFVLEGSEKEVLVANEVFEALNERMCRDYQEFWNRSEYTLVACSEPLNLSFDEVSYMFILSSLGELQSTPELSVTSSSYGFNITEILSTLREKFVTFFRSF